MTRRLPFVTLVAMLALAGLLAISYLRFQEPTETARATTPGSTSSEAAPTRPGPTIRCTPEAAPLPSIVSSDPCPDAARAVERAVEEVRLPLARIVIEPGPFYCSVIWPGVGSPAVCFGYNVQPGQFMHAWVSFTESRRVAAVMLGLDLPDDLDGPGATRPPWLTTLVAVEVPPDGWVMP